MKDIDVTKALSYKKPYGSLERAFVRARLHYMRQWAFEPGRWAENNDNRSPDEVLEKENNLIIHESRSGLYTAAVNLTFDDERAMVLFMLKWSE